MILQLVTHVNMHEDTFSAHACQEEYGKLYDERLTVRNGMKMYDVISPDDEQGNDVRLQGIPQFPCVVPLYLRSKPIAAIFLPHGHLLHQPNDRCHTSPALFGTTND